MKTTEAVKLITAKIKNLDGCRPSVAMTLFDIKDSIGNWKDTKYRTWEGFCRVEVNMANTTIYQYLRTWKLVLEHFYTLEDVVEIVDSIGWVRFRLGLTRIKSHISVKKFIRTFKGININDKVVFEEGTSKLTKFAFLLPSKAAERFTAELVQHGMRIDTAKRSNASAAMVSIIDTWDKD